MMEPMKPTQVQRIRERNTGSRGSIMDLIGIHPKSNCEQCGTMTIIILKDVDRKKVLCARCIFDSKLEK